MTDSIVQFKTQSGKPIQVGNRTITVRSRALQVKCPGLSGGIIWNRPTSVLVQTTDGPEQTLPVRDTTRIVQLLLLGLGLLSMLVLVGKAEAKISFKLRWNYDGRTNNQGRQTV